MTSRSELFFVGLRAATGGAIIIYAIAKFIHLLDGPILYKPLLGAYCSTGLSPLDWASGALLAALGQAIVFGVRTRVCATMAIAVVGFLVFNALDMGHTHGESPWLMATILAALIFFAIRGGGSLAAYSKGWANINL